MFPAPTRSTFSAYSKTTFVTVNPNDFKNMDLNKFNSKTTFVTVNPVDGAREFAGKSLYSKTTFVTVNLFTK